MNDRIVTVDQDPISVFHPLDAERLFAVRLESVYDRLGNRANLSVRTARKDDERVRISRELSYVQYHRLFGLSVERSLDD